jgi:hypothetical protein
VVPKVSLELVVATHHHSYFQYFNSSLSLSLPVVVLVVLSVYSNLRTQNSNALSPYVDLAHFGFTLSVIRRTCRRILAGWGGLN